MRERLAIVCLVVLLLLPAGCRSGASVPKAPVAPREEVAETSASVVGGQIVHLASGLTATVPEGWAGTYATYPAAGAAAGQYGELVSDALVVRRTDGLTTSPNTVMVDSRVGTGTPAFAHKGFEVARDSVGVVVWRGPLWSKPDYGLLAAQAFIPGGGESLVFFGGHLDDPQGSTKAIWRLMHLTSINEY